MKKQEKVTRFEVIDENGRAYSKWNCKVELSYQDGGKTLKVFISQRNISETTTINNNQKPKHK